MPAPEYLYHGSQYLFDIVKPQQACGTCTQDSQMAIYAAENINEVIPFALPIRWYPDDPTGKRSFYCNNGKTYIEYGSLDPDGIGYVYKLPSASFKKIDEWQWVSFCELVPEEIIRINVRDYLHTVEFSDKAKNIQNELFNK